MRDRLVRVALMTTMLFPPPPVVAEEEKINIYRILQPHVPEKGNKDVVLTGGLRGGPGNDVAVRVAAPWERSKVEKAVVPAVPLEAEEREHSAQRSFTGAARILKTPFVPPREGSV